MSESTITQLPDPSGFSADPFTDVIRDGARKLIEQAIHAELATLMAAFSNEKLEDGRARLVRHGHLPEDRVPDAKTVWLYRDALAQAGKVEELFGLFDGHLVRQGYIAHGGQILDASIVPVPRNHNTRDENAVIKKGEVPEGWEDEPAKRVQKDLDARWTKKHGRAHYGYKNHVNVDRKHKLVRRYHVSNAAQHDSQAVDHLLMRGNTGSGVWADAAYRSEEMEAKGSNRTKSRVRVRVEHIFGAQTNDMGGTLVRTIGLVRAKAKIGMKNLAYNMRRLGQLRRINPYPA